MFEIDSSAAAPVEALWRLHAVELVRFATVLVGPADANDIVADVFARYEKFIATTAVSASRAYLFRALTNRATDLHRARRRRWKRDLQAIGPVDSAGPDTFIDVRRAVANLSVRQRAVVYLAYWEDLSEREIADFLQLSPGTVHSHLTGARAELRKALS